MTTILIILGIGAALGAVYALGAKENPFAGALAGGMYAGGCLIQLIIPAIMVLVGLWLLHLIFS